MNAALDCVPLTPLDLNAVDLCWTCAKLAHWGRCVRERGAGFPSMTSHEKARIGRGGVYTGPSMPDDLVELDRIVFLAPPQHKRVIVEVYTKHGRSADHAARLQLSVRDYWRRKTRAEQFVCRRLQVLAQLG
jgi:hypothetical protein